MSRTSRTLTVAVSGVLFSFAAIHASEIGQQVAGQIDPATYLHYHSDLLYTHDGDDRDGVSGADHDPARDNIAATFQSFGLEVEIQNFVVWGDHQNVIATQRGIFYPDSYFVIGGHYDSVGNPGADDNASGVAGVLEIARVLSQYRTDYTIKYMAFDMEEYGLWGSDAYVQEHVLDDIRGMISMDMIAYDAGPRRCSLQGGYGSTNLLWDLRGAVLAYGNGLTPIIVSPGYGGSDHAPFEQAGFQACLFIEADFYDNPCYHQPCDSVDTPGYINYPFALDMTRSVAGYLADAAVARDPADCDGDQVPDADEIAADPSLDCNTNGILDICEIGGSADCDGDGLADLCEIFAGAADCEPNGVPDDCEPDCNANGLADPCDITSGASLDCNENGVPDECDVAGGASQDCNASGVPDECEMQEVGMVLEQPPDDVSGWMTAQDFADVGAPEYSVKQWDDFTLAEDVLLGGGRAFFHPPAWTGFGTVNFLVEIANIPGGAEAGGSVIANAIGTGEIGTGKITWYYDELMLPAGTYWLSVQAQGGYTPYGFVYWRRTNASNPNGSEHYYHNPGGAWGYGSQPVPASTISGNVAADMAFGLFDPYGGDCNNNNILDECDIRDGASQDANGDGIPDECQDANPPTPDPMTWEIAPLPASTTSITMTATQAVDPSGVEYRFYRGTGTALTGWQAGRSYVHSGLNPNNIYSYKVKARDRSLHQNETAFSTPVWWTATAIQTPTGISFANVAEHSVDVTAQGSFSNLNANDSGLYFEMTPAVPNSGANVWTHGTTSKTIHVAYLVPGTTYTFRVKARNFYGTRGPQYETPFTETFSITTPGGLPGDFNGDGQVNWADLVLFQPAFGTSVGQVGYDPMFDLNADGVIDCTDYAVIEDHWSAGVLQAFPPCLGMEEAEPAPNGPARRR